MQVKIKKLHPDAVIPKYAKSGDAGLDLTAISFFREDGVLIIGTGLAVEIPEGYVGLVFPRSSVSSTDMTLTNCVGVIDQNYRGEIMLKFGLNNKGLAKLWASEFNYAINESFRIVMPTTSIPNPFTEYPIDEYRYSDRVAQLIIMPYPQIELMEVDELSETERGAGGFGSTGK